MKAATLAQYGPPSVVRVEEVARPTAGGHQLLVKNHAAAVTAADARIRAARFPKGFGALARLAFGLAKPRNKVLGSTFSGVVEQVGAGVSGFAVGDEVCGMTGIKMGAHAEYVVVDSRKCVVKKPSSISHIDAAGMLFGGTTALYFLRDKGQVTQGESVCVTGASGAVGTNAVQLAAYLGANVTAVTRGDATDLVKKLGARDAIDYTKTSLVNSGKKFDVVLDTVGTLGPADAKTLLNDGGRLLLLVASLGQMLQSRGNVKAGTATEKPEDVQFLLQLMEQGALTTVIDSTYDLEDIVQAHQRADSSQKAGSIVIEF